MEPIAEFGPSKRPTYYIASSLSNVDQVRLVKGRLDALGWRHTYDWTVHGSIDVGELDGKRAEGVADAELQGVLDADVVVVLLPGGRGTHAELGMSIVAAEADADKLIYVYSPEGRHFVKGNSCVFYFHRFVERFDDLDMLVGTCSGAT